METKFNTYLADDFVNKLSDAESFKRALVSSLVHNVGEDPSKASNRDWFQALATLLAGVLNERNIRTAGSYSGKNVKKVYYLSMEHLIGRSLTKVIFDLGLHDVVTDGLEQLGLSFEKIQDMEPDAALGNGGLGRLAACFMDSLATHNYPSFGYGIRYEYGMFNQEIKSGRQVEHPENWLHHGNPWETKRPNVRFPVNFGGRVARFKNSRGEKECLWVDSDQIMATAYDVRVSGYQSSTVGNLRLWSASSPQAFDLHHFHEGNYMDAVRSKTESENLSKVLYPNDKNQHGQALRLKQEYFFVSASIQDLLERFLREYDDLNKLPSKVAIQLNDTHPALAVPELIRLLTDRHKLPFKQALEISKNTFSYTNHTLLPEALETWSIDIMQAILPRHLEIIYKLNDVFLRRVRHIFPGDTEVLRRVSLVDDDHHCIRMAHLAIVGSHKVNGVAELHTKLLRTGLFADFDRIFPGHFVNMTNGITPRRWLLQANPGLADLITEAIGPGWVRDLSCLSDLIPLADDAAFCEKFGAIKQANKVRLGQEVRKVAHIHTDPSSLFDSQVKRIHEYKRQLLNLFHVITRYNRIKDGVNADFPSRTVIFAGKAAPSYDAAKLILHLINDVAETVNNDPMVGGRLKVVFLPDYRVTTAEIIIPGSELSEQISTAGTEASGTGNMKFALNGALTIGTLDGANVEIEEEVGRDNIFIFGLDADGAHNLRTAGYDPKEFYSGNPELKRVVDMISGGFFSPDDPLRYKPVIDNLLYHGDHFLLLADYASYIECQERVDAAYQDRKSWVRKAILNVANMGKFSADHTIHNYAQKIWNIQSTEV